MNNLKILDNPSASELSMIMACAGLSNNLSALKTLSTDGIQRSHMKLHAKNVASQAGIEPMYIDEVVDFMISVGTININTANQFLESKKLYNLLKNNKNT